VHVSPDECDAFSPREAAIYIHRDEPNLRHLLDTGVLHGWRNERGFWRVCRVECDRYLDQLERDHQEALAE
jgi:hypothetical protein